MTREANDKTKGELTEFDFVHGSFSTKATKGREVWKSICPHRVLLTDEECESLRQQYEQVMQTANPGIGGRMYQFNKQRKIYELATLDRIRKSAYSHRFRKKAPTAVFPAIIQEQAQQDYQAAVLRNGHISFCYPMVQAPSSSPVATTLNLDSTIKSVSTWHYASTTSQASTPFRPPATQPVSIHHASRDQGAALCQDVVVENVVDLPLDPFFCERSSDARSHCSSSLSLLKPPEKKSRHAEGSTGSLMANVKPGQIAQSRTSKKDDACRRLESDNTSESALTLSFNSISVTVSCQSDTEGICCEQLRKDYTALHPGHEQITDGNDTQWGEDQANPQSKLGPIHHDGHGEVSQVRCDSTLTDCNEKYVAYENRLAKRCFDIDTKQGNVSALCSLGLVYHNQGDYTQAKHFFEMASAKDDPNGHCNLGLLYYNGLGVDENHKKAKCYFELAATQDHAHAQCMLGIMHCANQEYGEAKQLFENAAKQDDASALCNLAGSNVFQRTAPRL